VIRALATALLCAGLCAARAGGARADAGGVAPTPTPRPTPVIAAPNAAQGEAELPAEAPRATPTPARRTHRPPRQHRRREKKRRPDTQEAASPPPEELPAADPFRIPPVLVPIYRAAGDRYGVEWPLLAAINEIETDYGRNVAISSAGAVGWMQFMPASWERYGVDADRDGVSDPYDPDDAIHAAARYLRAAGVATDLRGAVFAYNHADWYVDSVLARARRIAGMPDDVVRALSALAGGRFPVDAPATYGVDQGGAPPSIAPRAPRRAVEIRAHAGAAVVAVEAGRIAGWGSDPVLGRFVRLRDASRTEFTYAHLGRLSSTYHARPRARARAAARRPRKLRLFAHPSRPRARAAGGARQLPSVRRLRVGARVEAGTVLGRLGRSGGSESHLFFTIRPAGTASVPIDPVPILEGWKPENGSAAGRLGPRPWGARLDVGRLGAEADCSMQPAPPGSRDQGRIATPEAPHKPVLSVYERRQRKCHRK
jgi:Transglycosylase SLT domain